MDGAAELLNAEAFPRWPYVSLLLNMHEDKDSGQARYERETKTDGKKTKGSCIGKVLVLRGSFPVVRSCWSRGLEGLGWGSAGARHPCSIVRSGLLVPGVG